MRQKKGNEAFQSIMVCFDSRIQSVLGYFAGWHQREDEVLSSSALEGRSVPLPLWWDEWEMPSGI